MAEIPTTTRAYTLKLDGAADSRWRESLWSTHLTVNRGVQAWGDWLLTLRGGLPASLANDHPERQVVLALSWLSVESPAEFAPTDFIIATGQQSADERAAAMRERFARVLQQKGIAAAEHEQWMTNCAPALTANIRPDAVWVDRSAVFEAHAAQTGIDRHAVLKTLFELLASENDYFLMPDEAAAKAKPKDFVIKAGGWLSAVWGAGKKSDAGEISTRLRTAMACNQVSVVGQSGNDTLHAIGRCLKCDDPKANGIKLFKLVKKGIGWKGNPSKGAVALERIRRAETITQELWSEVCRKFEEEAVEKASKAAEPQEVPAWVQKLRPLIEPRISMTYRTRKDHNFEFAVMLDHALRKASSAHTWIKRAEVERRAFGAAREAIANVPEVARRWLDEFCEDRTQSSAAADEYLIRRRAIDGWTELVQRWAQCAGDSDTDYQRRIDVAREMQADPEIEKFGDIQLFEAIAANDARCVWLTNGRPNADILKFYVNARLAEHDQRRFKVPAYRHPDALRHPVFVDFGNSRWNIEYTALVAAQERVKLREQLAKADTDIKKRKVTQKLAASPELHRVTLGLWTGEGVEEVPLKWHSKRLRNDLDFNHFDEAGPTVARGDRLGRAQTGTANAAITIAEVFQQKDWNGRLQAPRAEMDQLADYLARRGLPIDDMRQWDAGAKKLWSRLGWLLSFSAKLKPHGPWLDYVEQGLPEGVAYKKGRDGFFLTHEANKPRKGKTQLRLQRLPGLRIVSVDLGHRYAAACAVWETVSTSDFEQRQREALEELIVRDGQQEREDLYCHLKFSTGRLDKHGQPFFKTEIYRRIGPETLADGSRHPAPWARLDRQFLIRLQGEDRPCRAATVEEVAKVDALREWLGLSERQGASHRSFGDASRALDAKPVVAEPAASALRLTSEPILDPLLEDIERATLKHSTASNTRPRVDGLMAEAIRLAELGLKRLGFLARIANGMIATERPQMGGIVRRLDRDERIAVLQEELARWFELAHSTTYTDRTLLGYWYDHIVPLLQGVELQSLDETASRPAQKAQRESWKTKLRRAAETLVDRDNSELFELLQREWQQRETTWQKQHLRWLRDWLMPRSEKAAVKGKELRHVGGLSLKRIQTLRSLYKVMKAFHQRPKPDNLLAGKEQVERDAAQVPPRRFGQRMLDAFERLRENRIKQLASRIVEAALGVGSENRSHWDGHKRARQRVDMQAVKDEDKRRFKPCQAVVIENLKNYRPDETQTRRENRQLMDWSARNVRKFILEGCQLHGLYFNEAMPQYTSRQDSRTGAPGMRCHEVRTAVLRAAALQVTELKSAISDVAKRATSEITPTAHFEQQVRFWKGELERCCKRLGKADETLLDRYMIDLAKKTLTGDDDWQRHFATVCLPRRGAELFVSAQPATDRQGGSYRGIVQADLNAAANIGLRALMDPDWPGAWWYVPAQLKDGSYVPLEDKTTGLPPDLFNGWQVAAAGDEQQSSKKSSRSKNNPNLWRDLATTELREGCWKKYKEYQQDVTLRVIDRLRKMMRLDG